MGLGLQITVYPGAQLPQLVGRRLVDVFGGHLAAVDHDADFLPGARILADVGQSGKRGQVDVGLGVVGRVALGAIARKQRGGPGPGSRAPARPSRARPPGAAQRPAPEPSRGSRWRRTRAGTNPGGPALAMHGTSCLCESRGG